MSALAINLSPHGLGHSMVDAMTKPFNTWASEPYPPHSRYYPRELLGPSQRLPPPSSLAAARHASSPLSLAPTEGASKRGLYEDAYATTSHRHHSFSQSSTLGREPYGITNLAPRGREDVDRPRLSPAGSSTASDRSEETTPDPLRPRQLVRDLSSSQLPRLQLPSAHGASGYAPEPSRQYSRHAPPAGLTAAAYGISNSGSNSGIRSDQQQSPHAVPATPTSQWPARLLSESRAPPTSTPAAAAAAPSSSLPERMRISDLLSSEAPPPPPPPPPQRWRQQQDATTKITAAAPTMSRPSYMSLPLHSPPKQLTVRQQPAAARSCGFGERDRRVIDPPPIVQLRFTAEEGEDEDEEGDDDDDDDEEEEGDDDYGIGNSNSSSSSNNKNNKDEDDDDEDDDGKNGGAEERAGPDPENRGGSSVCSRSSRRTTRTTTSSSNSEVRRRSWIRYPFAVMHCAIWSEAGDQDVSMMPEDYRPQRRLMGTVVSSSFVGLDENGQEGCFFCFPDLSCRTPGSFRLKFSLVLLDPARSTPGSKTPVSAEVMSAVFTVYNAKDFPGMQASTPLTKRLKEQGCLISIKKGNEKGGAAARHDSDDDDCDYQHHAHGAGETLGRGRKRQRR